MLCNTCTRLINQIWVDESPIPRSSRKSRNYECTTEFKDSRIHGGHHRTIEDLQKAAGDNCHICSQLFRNWERYYWDTSEHDRTVCAQERIRVMVVEVMERQQRILRGKYNASRPWPWTDDEYLSRYEITTMIGQDSSVRELAFTATSIYFNRSQSGSVPEVWYQWFVLLPSQRVQQYTLPREYTSDQRKSDTWRQNLAQGWLQDCIKCHPQCSPSHSDWRPTRLLQVSKSQASTVKLILTKHDLSREHSSPYLTLSHCWGKVPFLTLTAQTKSQLLEGVDISLLPKTFQDALSMTMFLGFEYIWIDSLCIFQDSIDDWKNESALMGDVYGNSICNLAATGSPDGNGGLWVTRPPSLSLPCEFKSNLRPISDLMWHLHPRYLTSATLLLDGPLLKRGWVIQERILAPRTLHFGTNQLFWECRHYQACETYPGGLPDTMQAIKSNLATFDVLQKMFGIQKQDLEIKLRDVNAFWAEIVKGFSHCDLTKPEDKLVAISGLARRIQERHPQFEFIAGMLKQSLYSQLQWGVLRYGSPTVFRRTTAIRAPSWSWASIDAGVMIQNVSSEKEVMGRIIDIEVHEGDDPMGQNVSASLRIEAYLMTFGVRYGIELRYNPMFCINGVWFGNYSFYDQLHEFRDADEPFRNLHCLVLDNKPSKNMSCLILSCLLIQPTGLKRGQFKRYGYYEVFGSYCKLLAESDVKNVRNEEWLEYESVGEDGKYIVSII